MDNNVNIMIVDKVNELICQILSWTSSKFHYRKAHKKISVEIEYMFLANICVF